MYSQFVKIALGFAVGGVLTVMLAGCTTPYGEPNNTGTGALVGGVSGAGLGALLAHCNPGMGALVGGAAGAIAGGIIGQSMDQQARPPVYVAASPAPPAQETAPVPPPPRYVWVAGHWVWNGNGWAWVAGHWAMVP